MGRKPKPAGEKKSNCLRVMMTKSDRAAIEKAAADAGVEASTWVRHIALDAIRKASAKKVARGE